MWRRSGNVETQTAFKEHYKLLISNQNIVFSTVSWNMEVKMENCFQRLQALCNFTVIFPSTATGMDQNQSMWAERIGHISFKAESAFLKIPLRSLNMLSTARSTQKKYPLVIC